MMNKTVKIIIAANMLVCLILVLVYPHLMVSPGSLLKEHQDLTTDCFACHTPFLRSSPKNCITCHKVEEIGKVQTTGEIIPEKEVAVAFHQKLIESDCVACHSDHQGMKIYRKNHLFSHQLVLDAVRKECSSCHEKPDDRLHENLELNCGACHTQDEWKPATFDHDEYFRFDKHHKTECVTCHESEDYSHYTCYGCHEHSPRNIRKEHIEEGIRDYEQCTECHRSGDEDEAERIWKSKRGSYKRHDDDD